MRSAICISVELPLTFSPRPSVGGFSLPSLTHLVRSLVDLNKHFNTWLAAADWHNGRPPQLRSSRCCEARLPPSLILSHCLRMSKRNSFRLSGAASVMACCKCSISCFSLDFSAMAERHPALQQLGGFLMVEAASVVRPSFSSITSTSPKDSGSDATEGGLGTAAMTSSEIDRATKQVVR